LGSVVDFGSLQTTNQSIFTDDVINQVMEGAGVDRASALIRLNKAQSEAQRQSIQGTQQ